MAMKLLVVAFCYVCGGVRLQEAHQVVELLPEYDWIVVQDTQNNDTLCTCEHLPITTVPDEWKCKTLCGNRGDCKGITFIQYHDSAGQVANVSCRVCTTKLSAQPAVKDQDAMCYERGVRRHVGAHGDPHAQNANGDRFDIKRPGNHTFIVVPRGASLEKAKLHIEALVTPKGDPCSGILYITSIKLSGGWFHQLGGDIVLSAATDKFDSPDVVGLRLGAQGNLSLQEFASRIPKENLKISQSHPDPPTKPHTHVNTLTFYFRVGPSVLKVGWSHEQLLDGVANWLWLSASNLGEVDGNIGGLLGADDASEAKRLPEECPRVGTAGRVDAHADSMTNNALFGSWASATPFEEA